MKFSVSICGAFRRLKATRPTLINVILAFLILICFSSSVSKWLSRSLFDSFAYSELEKACKEPHSKPDGGDCQALGGARRPEWACFSDMKKSIPEFLKLYSKRVVSRDSGGMCIDHSFALWYILRELQPSVVIESGTYDGQSTWLIRETLPKARVISLDPRKPDRFLNDVEYSVGNHFTDFFNVSWHKLGVQQENALVLFDDHQSAYRRILKENKHGFKRLIFEDNYPYQRGDALSLKSICEVQRQKAWRGLYMDNFARKIVKQNWEDHLAMGEELDKSLAIYYEFPPLASSKFVTRKAADESHTSEPIIVNRFEFRRLLGGIDRWEFEQYTHIAYVELK